MADTKDTKKKNGSGAPAASGKKEPKVKKEKKAKVEKLFGYKKLPPLFKKAYSKKAFDKKIDKKLYVPQDKTYISGLFKDSKDKKGNPVLAVPKESQFTKKELKRLKTLAKEIKANKGRFKAVPFIAVASVIAAVVIVVTVFKNPAAKWAIRSTMQGIFGAKCDIGSVNVEILGAQITVNNLAQASSSDEYKNVFQFDKLDLDFNLTDLLRAKFHAENIEITGIAIGTERTASGKLPVKQKSAKEKEEKSDSTGFYESLKAKMGSDPDAAKKAITDLFAMYDPNAIAANIKDNLQSQKVAKEVEEEMKALVEQWKSKPEELKKSVDEVKEATKSLTSLNVSNVSAAEIPALLKQIETASSKIQSAKSNMETSLSSFSTDQDKIKALQQKLTDAIASDKDLLSSQLSVLDVSKAKQAISDTLNQAGYALLGQYYPYLKQLISCAGSMKSSSGSSDEAKKANKKAVETAKKESKRYAGRYVYWKADRVPKLLIEKVHGSGNGLDIVAKDISSDMDKWGSPWVASGTYNQNSRTHKAGLTVDARTDSKNPLVAASYSGNNFPLTLDLAKTAGSDSMPKFEGTSAITASLTADSDFSFSGSGSLDMSHAAVTAGELGSEIATRIYSEALSSIKSLSVGAKVAFSEDSGVDMSLSTNFDTLLANAISSVASKELESAKSEVMAKLNDQIGSSETAQKYADQFKNISSQINGQKSSFDSISDQLNAKKTELTKKTAGAATEKAQSAASSAAGSLLNKLKR